MNAKSIIARFVLVLTTALGLVFIPGTGWAASISCGQTVTNATALPSENDPYTFSGSAGRVISVSLWASFGSSSHSEVADIYDPSGLLILEALTDLNAAKIVDQEDYVKAKCSTREIVQVYLEASAPGETQVWITSHRTYVGAAWQNDRRIRPCLATPIQSFQKIFKTHY